MALPVTASLTDTTNTLIYTVPANSQAVVTINVAALKTCTVKIAITSSSTPSASDFVETGQPLSSGQVFGRTGIVLSAGYKIFVQSDSANAASVQIWGIEELL